MRLDDLCPHCGAHVNPTQPDCPECHREVPEPVRKAASRPRDPVARAKQAKWPVPWGLLIMLGTYFALVLGFTHWEYIRSPEYLASRHLRIAAQILGDDDGRTVEKDKLLDALANLLQAINQLPENTYAYQRVEVVARRLEERQVKVPLEMQRELDALGGKYRALQDSRKSFMPIGPRDIWDFDEVKAIPGRVLKRSALGGLVIFVFWLYRRLQERKHAMELALMRQTERRKDLRDLARPKRKG